MKILVLNYEYPPIGGGGGVISKYISEGLSKLGHEITVVTSWIDGLNERDIYPNIKIIRLKSKRKNINQSSPTEMLSWIKQAKHFLSNYLVYEKFDLSFANFALPSGEVAFFLKNKFKLPYVVLSHVHDIPWIKPIELYFYHAIYYSKLKKICRNSLANYVQSTEMKQNIDQFIGEKYAFKNILISNGCDIEKYVPFFDKKAKRLRILFVGRLVKQKDPMTFLKAIRLLAIKQTDFTVHILGDGNLRKKMENYVLKYNLLQVVFKGRLSEKEMISEYEKANLLIAPSINEGMSIAIIEAIFAGIYVITTPASGNSELISENINGNIIEFGNFKSIADCAINFYKEKFLNNYEIPATFLNDFKRHHNWQEIVKKYDNSLNKITVVR